MRLSPNPQYAVEEFTYVPADNNEINYDQEDNEIDSIGNNRNIPSLNNTKEPVFIENFENLRNITFRLTEDTRRKRKQETNVQRQKEFIVESNQVEFTEKNVKEKTNASSLVSSLPVPALECPELASTGFCSLTPDYPRSLVTRLMEECGTEALVTAWDALIPLDLDSLGDNSGSVISSQKDRDRPWSWTVSAYSKSQVCGSDLAFLQPSYARDTRGSLAREVSQPLMLFLPRSRCDHCPGRRCSPARVGGHVPQSGLRVSGSGHVRPPSPGHRGTEVAVCPEIHSPASPGHPPHLRHPLPRHHRRQVPLRLCLPRTDKPD